MGALRLKSELDSELAARVSLRTHFSYESCLRASVITADKDGRMTRTPTKIMTIVMARAAQYSVGTRSPYPTVEAVTDAK